jgi:hypothetical protein
MKARTIASAVVLCLATAAVCLASPQMGTWKLNEAKSKIASGMMKNTTVVYEAAGDSVKVTTDGTAPDGTAAHSEWTGKFDGKDYPVTGDPTSDARSYKQMGPRTLRLTVKKGGKVTASGTIVVSRDGKTRTVTLSGKNPQGKRVTSMAVYDKQ